MVDSSILITIICKKTTKLIYKIAEWESNVSRAQLIVQLIESP